MNLQLTFEEDVKKLIKSLEFNKELEDYIAYYGAILSVKCKFYLVNDVNTSEEKKEQLIELMTKFEHLLSPALKNSFLKGYQIGLELLSNQNTELDDEMLQELSLESQFIDAIEKYYSNGLYEFIRTAETHEFILFAIKNFEDIKPTLEQVLTEIAKFGALKVLHKLKHEKGIENVITKTTTLTQLPVNQFVPITPSIRAYMVTCSENIEIWSLVWNNTLATNPFVEIGEVTIVYRSAEQLANEVEYNSIYSTNLSSVIGMKETLELRVKSINTVDAPRIMQQTEYMIMLESLIDLFKKQTNIERENMIVWSI